MGRSMSQRKAKAYEDIERLKANRRKDLIKCAAALAAIVVLVTVKLGLETSGILEVGNMAVGAAMMMAGIGPGHPGRHLERGLHPLGQRDQGHPGERGHHEAGHQGLRAGRSGGKTERARRGRTRSLAAGEQASASLCGRPHGGGSPVRSAAL